MAATRSAVKRSFAFDLQHATGMTLLFFTGVFLTFAPVMVLCVRSRETPGFLAVFVWFLVSGTCGTLWALGGSVSRIYFFPAALLQLAAMTLIGIESDGFPSIHPGGTNLIGLVSALTVGAGYTCFVVYINKHGTKAVALATEMDLAAQIQRHLVPGVSMVTHAFEAVARSEASGAMGGDLVLCSEDADGSLSAIVADVAGHGVRAGVVMAMVKASIEVHRGRERRKEAPLAGADGIVELLSELNRVLVSLTEPDMFVTLAVIHVAPDGAVDAATAGHPPILVRRGAKGEKIERIAAGGMPLGAVEDAEFTATRFQLDKGDSVILYTDGLVEVNTSAGTQLGLDGLEQIVAAAPVTPSMAVLAIMDGVRAQSIGAVEEDDGTVLALRRRH